MKLTLAVLSQLTNQDLRRLETLVLNEKEISSVDDIGICVELKRVELSKNNLKSLHGLAFCKSVNYLRADHNQIMSLADCQRLQNLTVLNLAHNEISRIQHLDHCTKLKALILNDNKITLIENLEHNLELNTLVLSHNRLQDVINIKHLKQLKKLSVAHNLIRVIPDFAASCPLLHELRINDNKILSIPEYFARNASLHVLDIGNNLLRDFDSIEPLKYLLKLENLNLKGNPVTKLEGYKERIKSMIPTLKILDGERFDQAFLHRKLKKKVIQAKKMKKEENGDSVEPQILSKKRKFIEETKPDDTNEKEVPEKQEKDHENRLEKPRVPKLKPVLKKPRFEVSDQVPVINEKAQMMAKEKPKSEETPIERLIKKPKLEKAGLQPIKRDPVKGNEVQKPEKKKVQKEVFLQKIVPEKPLMLTEEKPDMPIPNSNPKIANNQLKRKPLQVELDPNNQLNEKPPKEIVEKKPKVIKEEIKEEKEEKKPKKNQGNKIATNIGFESNEARAISGVVSVIENKKPQIKAKAVTNDADIFRISSSAMADTLGQGLSAWS